MVVSSVGPGLRMVELIPSPTVVEGKLLVCSLGLTDEVSSLFSVGGRLAGLAWDGVNAVAPELLLLSVGSARRHQ